MSFYPRLKGLCTAKVNLQGSFLFVHIKDCTVRYWIQILSLKNHNAKAIQRSHWWNHSGFWPICKLLNLEEKLQQAEFTCTALLLVTLSIFTSAIELFHVLSSQMRGSRAVPCCSLHSLQLQMEPALNPDFQPGQSPPQPHLNLDKQDTSTPRFWLIFWTLSDKTTWVKRKVTEIVGKDTGKGNKQTNKAPNQHLDTSLNNSIGFPKMGSQTGQGNRQRHFIGVCLNQNEAFPKDCSALNQTLPSP